MIQTKFTAKTGMATISTANSNLDGTGSITAILTAGGNGTLIKNVIIKSQTNTTQGMIRFFVNDGAGNAKLIQEVCVPIITKSGRDYSFYRIIPFNYNLEAGDVLYASTETSDTFNIIAEALDWSYAASYTEQSIEFTANTGIAVVSTANSNLDGTGTCTSILQAGAVGAANGTLLTSLIIKAQQNVTPGMIRLYLKGGGGNILFSEISIPSFDYSATSKSFIFKAPFSMTLEPGSEVLASTENGENFSVILEGFDWLYLNS